MPSQLAHREACFPESHLFNKLQARAWLPGLNPRPSMLSDRGRKIARICVDGSCLRPLNVSKNSPWFCGRLSLMAHQENRPETSFGTRLWWLIVGRAAVASLVLLAGAVWVRGTFTSNLPDSLLSIKSFILVVAALTLVYSAAHIIAKNHGLQARVQFFGDVLLVTWLCWVPG